MSKDEYRHLVLKYVEEVWNNGDLSALKDLTSDSFHYHLSGQAPRDSMISSQTELIQIRLPWLGSIGKTMKELKVLRCGPR